MSKRFAVVLLAGLLLATSSFAGMTYTAKTKAEGPKGSEMQNSVVKGWVDGDNAKVAFIESGNPMMAPDTYLITRDGGKLIYLVNPKEKTFAKWDMQAMMSFAGGAMKMMNLKFSDPKVEKLDEGLGAPVAGIPTKRYKYRTSYTVEMKFMGMKQKTSTVQEEEIWSAPELLEAALGIWLRKEPPSFGDPQMDALVKAEMDKVDGFPLKRVMVNTTTDEKGKTQTTKTTMEVTELQMAAVPGSTFEIPAGYTETQLFPGGEGGEGNPLSSIFGGKKK